MGLQIAPGAHESVVPQRWEPESDLALERYLQTHCDFKHTFPLSVQVDGRRINTPFFALPATHFQALTNHLSLDYLQRRIHGVVVHNEEEIAILDYFITYNVAVHIRYVVYAVSPGDTKESFAPIVLPPTLFRLPIKHLCISLNVMTTQRDYKLIEPDGLSPFIMGEKLDAAFRSVSIISNIDVLVAMRPLSCRKKECDHEGGSGHKRMFVYNATGVWVPYSFRLDNIPTFASLPDNI